MTVVAVLARPPRPGLVLPELAGSGPLSDAEAADLYEAMLKDVLRAVDRSGGDLLVNYRAADDLPEGFQDVDSEATVRAVAADVLGGTDDVRFEVQVGSTTAARVGNTVTHLLREEGAASAGFVRPTAPFLTRMLVDSAAMKLRSTPVVLGPSTDGRLSFAAFTEPIDFDGALSPPELRTVTDHAADVDLGVDFVGLTPTVARPGDLSTALSLLDARRRAGRLVPEHTAGVVDDLGLAVVDEGDELRVVRD